MKWPELSLKLKLSLPGSDAETSCGVCRRARLPITSTGINATIDLGLASVLLIAALEGCAAPRDSSVSVAQNASIEAYPIRVLG